ncbi:hypothetical protein [Streptomyces narbonensis]|uniref:hypothetical protein n=1 Tax=Streptomyces narbonensis TaxID=67333 RepID=UPI0033E86909
MILVLIICVGALYGVGLRRYHFPGTWAHAFSPRHTEARKAWWAAREKGRDWARSADQDEIRANSEVTAARERQEKRLCGLDQRIAELSSPGRGKQVEALGELVLFQHELVMESPSGKRSLALAGLKVRFEAGQVNYSVYCTDADGHVYRAKYPHRASAPDSGEQLFDEDQVRDFAVTIQNTVAQENLFRARLPLQLKDAESKREEVQADTSEEDVARQRLMKIRQRNRTRCEEVEFEVNDASQAWEALTGRVPPR